MSLSDQDVDRAIENAGTQLHALCSDVERRLRASIHECREAEDAMRRAAADACRVPRWRVVFLVVDLVFVVALLVAVLLHSSSAGGAA